MSNKTQLQTNNEKLASLVETLRGKALLPSAEELTTFDQEEYRIKGETLACIAGNIEEYSAAPDHAYGEMTPMDMATAIATVHDSGYTAGYEDGRMQGEADGYDRGLNLTTLYHTTWKLNDTLSIPAIDATYNLTILSNGECYTTLKFKNGNELNYDSYLVYRDGRANSGSEYLTIIGGSSQTDASLIAFFKDNAQLLSKGDILINTSISDIPSNMFENSNLYAVDFPNVITIGSHAFYGSSLRNIVLPGWLKTIGASAFYGCNMQRVQLPATITSIGESAFKNCSELSTIRYNGTRNEWAQVAKGTNWASGTSVTFVTCLDGGVVI